MKLTLAEIENYTAAFKAYLKERAGLTEDADIRLLNKLATVNHFDCEYGKRALEAIRDLSYDIASGKLNPYKIKE